MLNTHLRRHVCGGNGTAGLAIDVALLQDVSNAVVGHVDGAVAQALDQVLWIPRQPAGRQQLKVSLQSCRQTIFG